MSLRKIAQNRGTCGKAHLPSDQEKEIDSGKETVRAKEGDAELGETGVARDADEGNDCALQGCAKHMPQDPKRKVRQGG